MTTPQPSSKTKGGDRSATTPSPAASSTTNAATAGKFVGRIHETDHVKDDGENERKTGSNSMVTFAVGAAASAPASLDTSDSNINCYRSRNVYPGTGNHITPATAVAPSLALDDDDDDDYKSSTEIHLPPRRIRRRADEHEAYGGVFAYSMFTAPLKPNVDDDFRKVHSINGAGIVTTTLGDTALSSVESLRGDEAGAKNIEHHQQPGYETIDDR